MSHKLLIVDDEAPNVRLLERVFREDYTCLTSSSGTEAMEILEQHEIAVLITDQRMPHMTGIELLKKSADCRPHMIRILLTGYTDVEAIVEAVNCHLVYMYVSKPWNNDDLKFRVGRAVEHYENNKTQHSLHAENARLTERVRELNSGFIETLVRILQTRNPYLYAHSLRVSRSARLLGHYLGLSEPVLAVLSTAGLLHDVAAVGESDDFVAYSRCLVPNARFNSNRDAEQAAKILRSNPELDEVADVVHYQNENFNGTGTPLGLIKDQIPLGARIVRVAREYDALTRPKDRTLALSHHEAMAQLESGSLIEFDPRVLGALTKLPIDQLTVVHESSRDSITIPSHA